ncbi:low-density lipoprotein receptor-related protein 1B-like [Hydractinia symbiolongicarpus]|uniref:low-density lipoprotein receptor-related protein 1B-like n=1 Tax=Hydractinia symbiolongicarpus TaxID=13093 RepID=UPI00254C49B0|nr:low-density lipoprotein receptor-related protein 1B-like [Hydractinia symbiolongicarpus]
MICSFILTSFHLLLLSPYVTSFPVKSLSLSKGVFECKNQEKIPRGWQCDGETDCQDGSDEINCSFIKRPCNDALGVSNAQIISDSNFHASSSCQSSEGTTFHPWYARLFQTEQDNGAGSWCASTMSLEPHWIAVNLGKEFVVTKIATQGRFQFTIHGTPTLVFLKFLRFNLL